MTAFTILGHDVTQIVNECADIDDAKKRNHEFLEKFIVQLAKNEDFTYIFGIMSGINYERRYGVNS